MKRYNPNQIEKKWQEKWQEDKTYEAEFPSEKTKWYSLIEFPYPSGAGLHTGHIRSFTAMDIVSRKRRMEGFNVLYPIGWDAFGLPTENYAIKTGIAPQQATKENVATFKRQMQSLGIGFDWSREVNTTDPNYYKWTQWIFIKMFEAGLAYKTTTTINWCTSCKIGLANEEVVNGVCERCGGEVVKKEKEQWMLKITAYAEKLLEGLDEIDYLPEIKLQQQNWIGKSEGINISYKIDEVDEEITCFSTRPETNFGATFIVLAPEHPLVKKYAAEFPNKDEVAKYVEEAARKNDIDRTAEGKEKTGVATGWSVTNKLNNKKLPIYVGDFVLATVGTGAVVGVPGHDLRDFQFATKMGLEIVRVVTGPNGETGEITAEEDVQAKTGTMVNSDFLDGMEVEPAIQKMMDEMESQGIGKRVTNYKLRDWVFSRQRYWGEPIPMISCEKCGYVPVPEKDLPVELPKVEKYEPRDDGESPLASIDEWVNTTCPSCSGSAKRETDVMPNWAGSSWYFLRYTDPKNDTEFASKEKLKYFTPIDWYNGGMEHVTLHLLYSRFWNQLLFDEGLIPHKEPYKKRTKHGMILGPDGKKMSKSKGNIVNPDPLIKEFGADALRLYEMFMGPFDQMIPWDKRGILGTSRFLEKVWRVHGETLENEKEDTDEVKNLLHKTIKKVGEDIESMSFNTSVSQMMVFVNECAKSGISKESWKLFTQVLAPFAPHIASEIWSDLGGEGDVHKASWPEYDESLTKDESFELVIQVNGKVRATITAEKGIDEAAATEKAKEDEKVTNWLSKGEIKKVIYVQDRLINFIVN